MGVSIIVGGQFGSEGKGKVARFYAERFNASCVVRVGGINSGHTVIDGNGEPAIFRVLPTAAIDRAALCVLPAGSYLDVDILLQEIAHSGIPQPQVKIDPNAVVVTVENREEEERDHLPSRVGSTGSGTGSAVSMRVRRVPDLTRARDVDALRPFLCDTKELLRTELDKKHEILIEGTQGFGLSNLHSPYYPYATSRDTSAAGFLSEAGLSPFDVTDIVMVIRTFPIRVAGSSGPLPDEITWEEVSRLAHSPSPIQEYTSVTKRLRRVGLFDAGLVRKAISVNRPNHIVLNHLDYIWEPSGGIGPERLAFIESVQRGIKDRVELAGLGPEALIEL